MFDLPIVGYRVVTMDHEILGVVCELGGGRFRVAGDSYDGWLKKEAVFTVEQRRVTLVCNRHQLPNYDVS